MCVTSPLISRTGKITNKTCGQMDNDMSNLSGLDFLRVSALNNDENKPVYKVDFFVTTASGSRSADERRNHTIWLDAGFCALTDILNIPRRIFEKHPKFLRQVTLKCLQDAAPDDSITIERRITNLNLNIDNTVELCLRVDELQRLSDAII